MRRIGRPESVLSEVQVRKHPEEVIEADARGVLAFLAEGSPAGSVQLFFVEGCRSPVGFQRHEPIVTVGDKCRELGAVIHKSFPDWDTPEFVLRRVPQRVLEMHVAHPVLHRLVSVGERDFPVLVVVDAICRVPHCGNPVRVEIAQKCREAPAGSDHRACFILNGEGLVVFFKKGKWLGKSGQYILPVVFHGRFAPERESPDNRALESVGETGTPLENLNVFFSFLGVAQMAFEKGGRYAGHLEAGSLQDFPNFADIPVIKLLRGFVPDRAYFDAIETVLRRNGYRSFKVLRNLIRENRQLEHTGYPFRWRKFSAVTRQGFARLVKKYTRVAEI